MRREEGNGTRPTTDHVFPAADDKGHCRRPQGSGTVEASRPTSNRGAFLFAHLEQPARHFANNSDWTKAQATEPRLAGTPAALARRRQNLGQDCRSDQPELIEKRQKFYAPKAAPKRILGLGHWRKLYSRETVLEVCTSRMYACRMMRR